MGYNNTPLKSGFSLIEVLFAITILIMVGLAMTTLNVAALKIIVHNEITTTATVLNDESLAYMALERNIRTGAAAGSGYDFLGFVTPYGCTNAAGCFVSCPATLTGCSLSNKAAPKTLGRSKLTYTQMVTVTQNGNGTTIPYTYTIQATTKWGNGARDQTTARQFLK